MNNISDFKITGKFSKVGVKSLALTPLFRDLGCLECSGHKTPPDWFIGVFCLGITM